MIRHCNAASPYVDFDEFDDNDPDVRLRPKEPLNEQDAAIRRYLARYLQVASSLQDFNGKLDADPVYRAQLETHGRALRDRGIVVSNALVEAVLEGLLRENAPRA